ncbi:hypothetical protein ACU4GD_36380 [Cupriavidus basilensis]
MPGTASPHYGASWSLPNSTGACCAISAGRALAVAALLLGYAWLPAQRGDTERAAQAGQRPGRGCRWPCRMPGWRWAMVIATLWWRRGFHLRVALPGAGRPCPVLGLIFSRRATAARGLAMIFLLPAPQAGALTSLLFALFYRGGLGAGGDERPLRRPRCCASGHWPAGLGSVWPGLS